MKYLKTISQIEQQIKNRIQNKKMCITLKNLIKIYKINKFSLMLIKIKIEAEVL